MHIPNENNPEQKRSQNQNEKLRRRGGAFFHRLVANGFIGGGIETHASVKS